MSYNAKLSISSWWILVLMALFLWYRNEKYDRALSIFVFTLGLIQLIEYGIYSGADPKQSGQAIFLTLWLQCLVLAIGVFTFINNTITSTATTTQNIAHVIAGFNLFLFSIIFVICLVISFSPDISLTASLNSNEQIIWNQNNSSILNKWEWLYLIGIFIPLFLIFAYYMWADLEIAILILYGIFSVTYITTHYKITSFDNLWCYLTVGFVFLAWFLGIFPQKSIPNIS
jgi:hypothetical protein